MFNLSLNYPSQCIKKSSKKNFFFNVKDKINYELTNLKKSPQLLYNWAYTNIHTHTPRLGTPNCDESDILYIKVFFSDYDNM